MIRTPEDRRQQQRGLIADWIPPADANFFDSFIDNCTDTVEKDNWMNLRNYLNSPFPSSIPISQPNYNFATSVETPMRYGVVMLNNQGKLDLNHQNPMVSRFVNSDSSMNSGYANEFNPQYFAGSSIKNVSSTTMFNNGISATEAFDSRTATPCHPVAHSSAPNFHQQKLCHQVSYNAGSPMSTSEVQRSFQNNPEATHFMGTTYGSHTSNSGTFVEPPVFMPIPRRWWMRPLPVENQLNARLWMCQTPVKNQSNGFKVSRVNSWESVQGQPFVAEGSSSHNCYDLNCNLCGPAAFGMTSGKRKYHSGPNGNQSWSNIGDIMESRKRKSPSGVPNNESWVGSGTLMDVLTNSYMPVDLPPLEQCPNSSEDASVPDYMKSGPEGKEETSQLDPNVNSGTLMDVYDSFIKSSASTKDAMPNSEEALGPKVNTVPPELSIEENVICGFNSALDDYESILESMKCMEPSVLESEKTSMQITSVDHSGSEVEATNIETPSVSLAEFFEYNGSEVDATNIETSEVETMDVEKPSVSLADSFEDNDESGSGSGNIKKVSASLADSLTVSQITEHLACFVQPKEDISGSTTPSVCENPCQLCSRNKLSLAPTPIYCSCCDLRIKQNVKYYRSTDVNTKQCICMSCFRGSRGSTITTRGGSVTKANLHMAKNDDEVEDSWVQCDACQHWQHRICGLYNNETDLEGKAEYVCPKCCLQEIENGTRISLPKAALGAKDLQRTNLSDHIEQRLFKRMKQEREETATLLGIASEKVLVAEGLVVRVVVSVDKELEVTKQFRDIFDGQNYPEKVGYRSKLILLFQKIGGLDVCLFGMYVQEFGSECNGPNNRCVYISYIDSVKYFQPERKTATGEPLRTFVYHEILIGYLEHCKKRGFASCYIWSCPLIKGQDYIFYCHPKTQKTPEKTKLRQWYNLMIKKAAKDGIVVGQTNLYKQFFTPSNTKISAAHLPYFDGDFWSDTAENISKTLDDEECSGGKLGMKSRGKRIVMANGQECLTKDAQVMHNLGEIILPNKENYMIIRLQHVCKSCNEVILSGSRWFCKKCNKIQLCSRCISLDRMHKCCSFKNTPLSEDLVSSIPVDTKDEDDVVVNKLSETRDDFLNKCQNSLYQFDTLEHAKYSSMMILYHLKQNAVAQPKGDTCNSYNLIPPPTEVTPEPRIEQSLNQVSETLNRALDALIHSFECKSAECCLPDCQSVKTLISHASGCTRGRHSSCETCQGAWWVLDNHINTCTKPDCTIPCCKDIRRGDNHICRKSDFCKLTN